MVLGFGKGTKVITEQPATMTDDYGVALGVEGAFGNPGLEQLVALRAAEAAKTAEADAVTAEANRPTVEAEQVVAMEALQKYM